MPEPSTSTAAGIAGWKLAGGAAGIAGFGVSGALLVVLAMRMPKTAREWVVALVSTVMSSIGLGSALMVHFDLLRFMRDAKSDMDLFFVAAGLSGFVFTCGLPGWLIVRLAFKWIDDHWNSDLKTAVADAKDVLK